MWSGGGSNSRPVHCERTALPVELPPQVHRLSICIGSGVVKRGRWRQDGGTAAILPNFFALTRCRKFVTFRPQSCPEGAVHEILSGFPDRGRNPVSVRLPATDTAPPPYYCQPAPCGCAPVPQCAPTCNPCPAPCTPTPAPYLAPTTTRTTVVPGTNPYPPPTTPPGGYGPNVNPNLNVGPPR